MGNNEGDDVYEATEPGDAGGQDQADELAEELGEAVMAAMDEEDLDPVEVRPEPRARRQRQPPPAVRVDEGPVLCVPSDERIPRSLTSPIKPSAETIEKHNITHLPPRP